MIGCREPGIVVRSVGENPAGPKLYEMVKVYVGTASSIADRDFQEDAMPIGRRKSERLSKRTETATAAHQN